MANENKDNGGELVPQAVAREIDPLEEIQSDDLKALLEMVADKRGLKGVASNVWVGAVKNKMRSIEVETVRDFVSSVMLVNRRLYRAHHSQMNEDTLTAMLEEACDMMWGPTEEEEGGE
jgi:hypothetical protein